MPPTTLCDWPGEVFRYLPHISVHALSGRWAYLTKSLVSLMYVCPLVDKIPNLAPLMARSPDTPPARFRLRFSATVLALCCSVPWTWTLLALCSAVRTRCVSACGEG